MIDFMKSYPLIFYGGGYILTFILCILKTPHIKDIPPSLMISLYWPLALPAVIFDLFSHLYLKYKG